MSAIVDYEFYSSTYLGEDVDGAERFSPLCAHAERVIGSLTHWAVTEENFSSLPSLIQNLYRLAICAQIDFLSLNGTEALQGAAGVGTGFTVGKVTVQGRATAAVAGSGSFRDSVSPAAIAYLEQTGLMNPQVPCLGDNGILWG